MDFNKPGKPLPPLPASEPLGPGVEDDGMTGAGSDFWIWSPTIGPGDASGPSYESPMSVEAPGIDPGPSLAAQLNWRTK